MLIASVLYPPSEDATGACNPPIPLCQVERSERPLQEADLVEGRLPSTAYAAMAWHRLSSPGLRPFRAKQQSRRRAILRFATAQSGAAAVAFDWSIAIEAATVRPESRGMEH